MKVETLPLGPLEANCYLLADGRGEAVVIDPGAEGRRVTELARRRGWRIRLILATHAHFDHVGGAAEVAAATSAPFWVPRGDAGALAETPRQARQFGLVSPAPPAPARLLDDKDEVSVGGVRLTVLAVPGHTSGEVAFLAPDGTGVFTGDLLFAGSVGRSDLPGGDGAALLRSIRERILVLPDPTPVYPGHGPATTVGRERRSNPFLVG